MIPSRLKILFILLLGLSPAIHSASSPLKIGMELSYPPFETIDKEGRPYGISVDLALALGLYLDKEVKIENIPFIGLIPALQGSKIDLILSSMSKSSERELSISFSDPYLFIGLCLLISQKSDLQDISKADEKGRKIVVKQATSGQYWAQANLQHAKIIILDKESSCILEVVQGKADAFIFDQLGVYHAWQKHPESTRANLHAFQEEPWAIGLRKQDVELKNQVNAFLKKFRDEGGFALLATRFLKKEQAAFIELGIPFPLK